MFPEGTTFRTGALSSNFGKDPKTITHITDIFENFFSKGAVKEPHERRHRIYTPKDVLIINTVLKLRDAGLKDDEIRIRLDQGEIDDELPPDFFQVNRQTAIMQYGQFKALQAELAASSRMLEDLRLTFQEMLQSRDAQLEEKERQIRELERQIGKLEAQKEMLELRIKEDVNGKHA